MLSVLASLLIAQTANPYLVTARELVRELKFADAIVQLEIARQVPNLDRQQRLETLELLAKCEVAEGNREKAEAAMSELLSLRPEHELDRTSTSPKIVELFDAVKRRLFPDGRVSLVEETAPPGRARVRLVDPFARTAVAELRTKRGDGEWQTEVQAAQDGTFDLPLPTATSEPVRWYLQVVDTERQVLASLASENEPRLIPSVVGVAELEPPTGPRPRLVAGVLIGIAAIAVLIGATALEVSAQALDRASRDRTRPPGDWADTARLAHQQAVTQASWALALFIGGGVTAGAAVVTLAW